MAVGVEPDDDNAVGGEVRGQPPQHLGLGAGRQGHHDVPRADDGVERLADPAGRQVEFGQIPHQPGRPGMIRLGGGDERGIDIHADDGVSGVVQVGSDAAGTAAGVEDSGSPGDHRIDQSGLAAQIGALGGHGPEAFDVPLAVTGFGVGDPAGRRGGHPPSLFARPSCFVRPH